MKNYTITVNGNVYDVTVEEGASTGTVAAPVKKSSSQGSSSSSSSRCSTQGKRCGRFRKS